MIQNLIGSIRGKVLDIVDDVVEDKDEANRLKFEVQRQLIQIKSGDIIESGDGANVISMTAWRQDTMTGERWNQLKTLHENEIKEVRRLIIEGQVN